jgi:arsenite/tail-anchored protein-transporting ATPase
MTSVLHFFIGKGGVGKSTTSALTALHLARSGHRTLLVSLDPAHNQRDIFETAFSEKPTLVHPRLAVREIDVDRWVKNYLKESSALLKKAYAYQSAFNIQRHFNVLKFAPGLEEHAMLLAFDDTVHRNTHMDDILFDMPPTALTLRFFSLPSITCLWLKELLDLRSRIYAKKAIVSKIKWKSIEIEQDKVRDRLQTLIDDSGRYRSLFTAASTHINLVLNNDPLSRSEAERICGKLKDIDMSVTRLILNKCDPQDAQDALNQSLKTYPVRRFPLSRNLMTGLTALEDYLLHHPCQTA